MLFPTCIVFVSFVTVAYFLFFTKLRCPKYENIFDSVNQTDLALIVLKWYLGKNHIFPFPCSFFLVLMFMLMSLVFCLSHKCEPGSMLCTEYLFILSPLCKRPRYYKLGTSKKVRFPCEVAECLTRVLEKVSQKHFSVLHQDFSFIALLASTDPWWQPD